MTCFVEWKEGTEDALFTINTLFKKYLLLNYFCYIIFRNLE